MNNECVDKQISVLIVDDDVNWCSQLGDCLKKRTSFNVLTPVHDGSVAIEIIELRKPNIILLDLILPGCEGRGIVKHIATQMTDYRPLIYIISGVSSQKTKARLSGYESVVEYSVKHIEPEDVLSNIFLFLDDANSRGINAQFEKNNDVLIPPDRATKRYLLENIDGMISEFLIGFGIKPGSLSGRCMHAIIKAYIRAGKNKRIPLTELRDQIGKSFDPPLSAVAVERNIRYAVQKACSEDTVAFRKYFPNGLATSASFVQEVVHILFERMDYNYV